MFKPIEVYCEKKAKKLGNADINTLKNKYQKLSAKKQLKFIRKAERKYDSYVEENPDEILPSFGDYLNKKELLALFKAYGMPEKPAINSRQALLNKLKNDAIEIESVNEKKAFQHAIEKYKQMSEVEKAAALGQYQQAMNDYHEEFFNFARNLPSQRVIDYRNLFVKKATDGSASDSEQTVVKKEPHQNGSNGQPPKKKDKREAFRLFTPYIHYLKKNPQEESDMKDVSAFLYAGKMRALFTHLPDKKKLKFIKDAEKAFDSFTGWDEIGETREPFSAFLNKKEIMLLLESYGMPQQIPINNPRAYFFKIQMKEGKLGGMRQIFEAFKNMNDKDKANFLDEYNKVSDAYLLKRQKFLENLPLARGVDYNLFITKAKKNSHGHFEPGAETKTKADPKSARTADSLESDDTEAEETLKLEPESDEEEILRSRPSAAKKRESDTRHAAEDENSPKKAKKSKK